MEGFLLSLMLLFLIGFFLFVRWDRGRIERSAKPPERGVSVPIPTAQGRAFARVCIGMSAVVASLALADWSNPSHPPFTGRWSSVSTVLYSLWGPLGTVWFKLTMSLCLLVLGRWVWRRTPKRPSDKLFF